MPNKIFKLTIVVDVCVCSICDKNERLRLLW